MIDNNESQVLLIEDKHVQALPRPEILILDLDLTLHNVIEHYEDSVNETLLYFGYQALTQKQLDAAGGDNFTTTKAFFAAFLPEKLLERAVEYYFNHFLNREIPASSVLPGAKELLYLVKKRISIPIIGITNSEELLAKKILADLGALGWFDSVVGIKDGRSPKPHSQMLLIALDFLKAKPGPQLWFMGDRCSDTQCAKDSNCTAIRFYDKIKPEDENADLFIDSHYHFFDILNTKFK